MVRAILQAPAMLSNMQPGTFQALEGQARDAFVPGGVQLQDDLRRAMIAVRSASAELCLRPEAARLDRRAELGDRSDADLG